MQRYFSYEKNSDNLVLSNDDLYHIKKVMRMNIGDNIEVVFDKVLYICELDSNWNAHILREGEYQECTIPKVNLIIPLLKEQKMDYIFQKAVELGVYSFTVVPFERTVVKITDNINKKIDRWNKICKEASEQSKRIDIPEVNVLKDFCELKKLEGVKFLCSTQEKQNSVKKVLKNNNTCDTINVVIGPEGGMTPLEEQKLEELYFTKVTLGNQILRVETVPLYIMSIIQYEYMK